MSRQKRRDLKRSLGHKQATDRIEQHATWHNQAGGPVEKLTLQCDQLVDVGWPQPCFRMPPQHARTTARRVENHRRIGRTQRRFVIEQIATNRPNPRAAEPVRMIAQKLQFARQPIDGVDFSLVLGQGCHMTGLATNPSTAVENRPRRQGKRTLFRRRKQKLRRKLRRQVLRGIKPFGKTRS